MLDLEVQRPHAQLAAGLFQKRERLGPDAAAAVALADVDLVHKGVAAAVLQAVAERQHYVADRLRAILDQPDPPERLIAQQAIDRWPQRLLVERVLIERAELAVEDQQQLQVGWRRASKCCLHIS